MSTPFKLKSGNNPDKKGFFQTLSKEAWTAPRRIKKKIKKFKEEGFLKGIGWSDKDIKGK
jgi:hypothetical protein